MRKECEHLETAGSYVRDELSSGEREQYAAHLEVCAECTEMVHGFSGVLEALQPVRRVSVSSDFTDRVVAAAREDRMSKASIPFPALLRVAAALVALLSVVWLVNRDGASTQPEDSVVASSQAGVDGAVEWLLSAQESSGGWDPVRWDGREEFEVALTGLSLMTLLEGQTDDPAQVAAIDRAVAYLSSLQGEDGALGPANDARMYNQGIALSALLKAYEARPSESLSTVIDKALAYTRSRQDVSGGWSYANRRGERPNSAVSIWQLHTLQTAERLGLSENDVALRKGLFWLRGLVSDGGYVGYDQLGPSRGGTDALTAMGAFCLFEAEESYDGLKGLNDRLAATLNDLPVAEQGVSDFYQAFFLVSAMQSRNSEKAQDILKNVQGALLTERVQSGTHRGSWEPVGRWSGVGGRLYSTCLAALSLRAG